MNILRQQRGKSGNRGGGSRQEGTGGGALTRSGALVCGAYNEAPAAVSVVVVEIARGTEITEAFIFVARRRFILSLTGEARSNLVEGEAVGRQEVA